MISNLKHLVLFTTMANIGLLLGSTPAFSQPKMASLPKVGDVCEVRPGVLGTKEFCSKQNTQSQPSPMTGVCPIAIVLPKNIQPSLNSNVNVKESKLTPISPTTLGNLMKQCPDIKVYQQITQ